MRTSHLPALLATCLLACSGGTPPPKEPVGRSLPPASDAKPTLAGPAGLPAALVATLENTNLPVSFSTGPLGGLFVFASAGRVYARAVPQDLGDSGTLPEPKELGSSTSVAALSVKPLRSAEGEPAAFVVFWDERIDQTHVFHVARVGGDGSLVGSALTLAPVAEADLGYADVTQVGDRLLVLYEVTPSAVGASGDGRASVYVLPIDASFERASAPTEIFRDALTWSGATSGDALLLARVAGAPPSSPTAPSLGMVRGSIVGPDGKVREQVEVLGSPSAQIDLEVAAVREGWVLGWTDESAEESAVRVATVSTKGAVVRQPAWLAPPIGRQTLVGLAGEPRGNADRAVVAWEHVGQAAGDARIVHLATVGLDGAASPGRTRLALVGAERPDLVADEEGFAALTLAGATLREGSESNPDAAQPTWPILVRLGPDLSVESAEPVRFPGANSPDGVPSIAWGLSCAKGRCFGLSADGDGPTRFHVFASPERESAWRAPAWREEDERPPTVVALRSTASESRVSSAKGTRLAGSTATAWVTYFLDGATPTETPPKGEPPYAATLGLRFSDPAGNAGAPVIVSKRAVSFGGVSVASAGPSKKDEVVVAWVAADKSGPQVFATKVDADGAKVAQKKVTVVPRSSKDKPKNTGPSSSAAMPGERGSYPFGVTIDHAPPVAAGKGTDGFVVGWLDTRDGSAEVYLARLNAKLEKTVVDKRVSVGPGDASDLTLAVRGPDAFVVYADQQGAEPTDIHFARFDAQTLQRTVDPGRVYASATRSRSPRLAFSGSKLVLGWIEEGARDGDRATLRLAEIDATGRLVSAPKVVEAPAGGSVIDFALTCREAPGSCKLALAYATAAGRVELAAAPLDAAWTIPQPTTLGVLSSGPLADPCLSFTDAEGSTLTFLEDVGERGRVREVALRWGPDSSSKAR